jgi:SAM-dependent methyltransferase
VQPLLEDDLNDQSYTYHGNDDALASWTAMFTSRNGDGRGDHEENFLSAIKLAAACKSGGAFLDVGSGLGRIIDQVKPYAGRVTGLEPDHDRFTACKNGFAADKRIEILKTTSWDYVRSHPGRNFDFVTLSMVLQHVSTRACQQILSNVRELTAPDGVAIVSTTHLIEERFTYESDPAPHDVGEFDRYADRSESQDRGIPVRWFSKESFFREIEQAGLEVIVWQEFSYVRPENVPTIASLYGFTVDQVRDLGVSQYAVVRERRRPAPRRSWLPSFR